MIIKVIHRVLTQLQDSNWSVENALEVFFENHWLESSDLPELRNPVNQDSQAVKELKAQAPSKNVDSNIASANQPSPAPTMQAASPGHLNDLLIFSVIQKKPRSDLEKLLQRGADVNCLCPRPLV